MLYYDLNVIADPTQRPTYFFGGLDGNHYLEPKFLYPLLQLHCTGRVGEDGGLVREVLGTSRRSR